MAKKTISPDFLAALNAGAASPEAAAQAAALAEDADTPPGATPPAKTGEDTPPAADAADTPTPEANANPHADPNANKNANPNGNVQDSAIVAHMREELKAAREEIAGLNVKIGQGTADLKAANEKLATYDPYIANLQTIVRAACSSMSIALGNTPAGLDSMTGESLTNLYAELSNSMKTRFTIGGKASTLAAAAEPKSPGLDHNSAASAAVKSTNL